MDIYIPCSFVFYFLSLFLSLLRWRCLLPVDSFMSLSVTKCNWFCQGQSIALCQASSAGDRGCIAVKLYSAYWKHTVCLCMCACVCLNRIRGDVVKVTSHLTSALTDSMSKWNTATDSKPTNQRRAKLQEVWEEGQSNLWMIILMFIFNCSSCYGSTRLRERFG